ncbi:MAG: hypothetical protein Q9227_000699 [Pyrenula ochraceoflavens]
MRKTNAQSMSHRELENLGRELGPNDHRPVRVHGFLGDVRQGGKGIKFARLVDPHMRITINTVFIPYDFEKEAEQARRAHLAEGGTNTFEPSEDTTSHRQGDKEIIDTVPRLGNEPASDDAAQEDFAPKDTMSVKHQSASHDATKDELALKDADAAEGITSGTEERNSDHRHNESRTGVDTERVETNLESAKASLRRRKERLFDILDDCTYNSPVTVVGNLRTTRSKDGRAPRSFIYDPVFGKVEHIWHLEIEVQEMTKYNQMPNSLVSKEATNFPPEKRYLQIRTSSDLRRTLRSRSRAMAEIRKELFYAGFDEIETPLLFRSSPEGAREFIVPTRQTGKAYALAQSPQQYKQILMASGIAKYFQFAKCFRDEDLRADRQPEFTQLDLEMSFVQRRDIFCIVENIVKRLWFTMKTPPVNPNFDVLTWSEAMNAYGTEKPDRRIGSKIHKAPYVPQDVLDKITTIVEPTVEIMSFTVSEDPDVSRSFIGQFLESDAGEPFRPNPTSAPGIFIFDPSKPAQGLSAFGFEATERVEKSLEPRPGDLIILHARQKTRDFGGQTTTVMGALRLALFEAAIRQGLRQKPVEDDFVWIHKFPMFERATKEDPGQGGSAGIKARHHPFTNPSENLPHGNFWLKDNFDPLSMWADSWDLVINGVEVGGGSIRMHQRWKQEVILRDILKMPKSGIEKFEPLLDALSAGCPPHGGMALGFDRLLTILLDKESVKDVMAFPKTGKGQDKMVGSPATISDQELDSYHLRVAKS